MKHQDMVKSKKSTKSLHPNVQVINKLPSKNTTTGRYDSDRRRDSRTTFPRFRQPLGVKSESYSEHEFDQ